MKILPVTLINRHFKSIFGVLICFITVLLPLMILMITNSPNDYLQDELVKIMYIHVPSAWLALGLYSLVALNSFLFIIFKNSQYYICAKNFASIGSYYALLALITGSIWGKPAWGTWWVWDARLTSMLLLLFIYMGYQSLSSNQKTNERHAVLVSYYAIASFIIIPIIKFSVDVWSTLHQPASILRWGGPSIHFSIFKILLISLLFHIFFTCLIFIIKVKIDVLSNIRLMRKNSEHKI